MSAWGGTAAERHKAAQGVLREAASVDPVHHPIWEAPGSVRYSKSVLACLEEFLCLFLRPTLKAGLIAAYLDFHDNIQTLL